MADLDAAVVAVSDVGDGTPMVDGGTPSIVDLLDGMNDFENGTGPCTAFDSYNGTDAVDSTPHSRARPCRVCRESRPAA